MNPNIETINEPNIQPNIQSNIKPYMEPTIERNIEPKTNYNAVSYTSILLNSQSVSQYEPNIETQY